jgi:hypothetical protein
MATQHTCPICTEAFKKKEIVVEYRQWGTPTRLLAHLDCVLVLSKDEDRKHPG